MRLRRIFAIQVVSVVSLLLLLAAGGVAFALPAVGVGLIGTVVGLGCLARDLDEAVHWLGVAVIASGVVLLIHLLGGDLGFLLLSVLSAAGYLLAWDGAQRRRAAHRREVGRKQRASIERARELDRRREALRNRLVVDLRDGGDDTGLRPDLPQADQGS